LDFKHSISQSVARSYERNMEMIIADCSSYINYRDAVSDDPMLELIQRMGNSIKVGKTDKYSVATGGNLDRIDSVYRQAMSRPDVIGSYKDTMTKAHSLHYQMVHLMYYSAFRSNNPQWYLGYGLTSSNEDEVKEKLDTMVKELEELLSVLRKMHG